MPGPKDDKHKDPSWTRARELANIPWRKKVKPKHFKPGVAGIVQANSALGRNLSTQEKSVQGENPGLFSPGRAVAVPQLSTPAKGNHSRFLATEDGHFRNLLPFTLQGQKYGYFVDPNACPLKRLSTPSGIKLPAELSELAFAKASFGAQTFTTSKADFEKTSKMIRERRICGQSTRQPSNQTAMGESAYNIAQAAGLKVEARELHITHLIPHAIMGDLSQNPENMGIAPKQANAAMELVNSVIETLLRDPKTPDNIELTITATPTYIEPRQLRIFDTIHYEITDNYGHQASFEFDMLSNGRVPENAIRMCEQAIYHVFHNQSPQQALTPMAQVLLDDCENQSNRNTPTRTYVPLKRSLADMTKSTDEPATSPTQPVQRRRR